MVSTSKEQCLGPVITLIWYHKNTTCHQRHHREEESSFGLACHQSCGKGRMVRVAGCGPCGRPHPMYVMSVLSADGHMGRTLQMSTAAFWRTGPTLCMDKRTQEHDPRKISTGAPKQQIEKRMEPTIGKLHSFCFLFNRHPSCRCHHTSYHLCCHSG